MLLALGLPTATLAQATAPVSSEGGADIRVPAGRDWQAPPGVDLTAGFTEGFSTATDDSLQEPGDSEWVLVPIPFRNALLGLGLQVGVGRLYKPEDRPAQKQASMFGVAGMYAEGGSWAAAAGDRRYWGDGRLRTTLAAGAGNVNYDVNLSALLNGLRLPVEQDFSGGLLKVGYEAREHLWLSAGFKAARSEVRIKWPQLDQDNLLLLPRLDYQVALVNLEAEWDSRSDQFYPQGGALMGAKSSFADPAWGADTDYQVYELSYSAYKALSERHTLAWRIAGKLVEGNAPFFSLAWFGSGVDLRGYAPGTYIGKSQAAVQAEWRWQATRRLGVVAFGGVGGVWGDVPVFEQDDFLPAGGLGLRWRLTEKFRVNFRVDYAWGKDDQVLLISAGEAF